MKVSRRDILKVLGGGMVGTVFSPIPWKLLRDSSVWTQNWPWVPVPMRGKATTAYTACTLCPSACGVRVRCIGGRPVSLTGVSDDPGDRGALCAAGNGAHQLPWHPDRVRTVLRRTGDGVGRFEPATTDEAVAAVVAAITATDRPVAVLDGRPGRAIGGAYRELLAGRPGAQLLTVPGAARASMVVLRGLHASDPGPLAVDLDAVETIVGFSAPILDGWGQPGVVQRRMDAGRVRLVQFEAVQSRTAVKADRWVPITPGTEGVVALGLARLLIGSGRANPASGHSQSASFSAACAPWTPRRVFEVAGVDEATLTEVAGMMAPASTIAVGGGDAGGGPLSGEDEASIQALNLLLGAVGKSIRSCAAVAGDPADAGPDALQPRDLADAANGSIGVLIVDVAMSGAALPWPMVAAKLAPGAVVVALTPVLTEAARNAQWVIPTAAPFTAMTDCPGHPDFPATIRLARGFLAPDPDVVDPVDFLNRLGVALGVQRVVTAAPDLPTLLAKRVETLHRAGGTVSMPGETPVPMAEVASEDDLLDMLKGGGCWRGGFAPAVVSQAAGVDSVIADDETVAAVDPVPPKAPGLSPDAARWAVATLADPAFPMHLVVTGGVESTSAAARSPILSKVDQESGLRPRAQTALMNPATIASHGLHPRRDWLVATAAGSQRMRVEPDPGVPPGVLLVSAAPQGRGPWQGGNPINLATPDGTTWRLSPAHIREA